MKNREASEVLEAWEISSQYWSKHQAVIEKMFMPLTKALIAEAHVASGDRVLDIGGGAGEPTLSIANLVGEAGHVSYTDPSAGMVHATRTEAERRGLTNIDFNQCVAEEVPFRDSEFDATVGRLSAMFFADVEKALHQALRVTKPGGYVSLLVWAAREYNPFFNVITEILERFIPSEPEEEDAPGAFRFARPGKLATLIQHCGAGEVRERTLDFEIAAPIDVMQFYELRTEMSDTLRAKLAKLSAAQIEEFRNALVDAATPFFTNGAMSFPARALIVTGRSQG